MLNLSKHTKTKPTPKPTLIFKNCSCVCVSWNSSDNFPSYPPDKHHSLDLVYWRRQGHGHSEAMPNYKLTVFSLKLLQVGPDLLKQNLWDKSSGF